MGKGENSLLIVTHDLGYTYSVGKSRSKGMAKIINRRGAAGQVWNRFSSVMYCFGTV